MRATKRHTSSSTLSRYLFVMTLPWLVAACGGGGGGGGGSSTIELDTVAGQVIDGNIEAATVCLDANANGKCDADERQTRTDAAGGYQLGVPKNSTGPLVAEVVAGRSRDSDQPGVFVDASYRMVSPSAAYGTTITPYSTMVHLTGEKNFALAEDLTRNALGLPSNFDIRMTAPAPAGSLTQATAKSVVVALKATNATLDMSVPGAFDKVVAALPSSLTALPVLTINTKNAAPIVSREDYVDATFVLINPALPDQVVSLNGKIRGRGHSTWGWPKNPYKVQFSNDASYAKVTDVLGMKPNRNWALLAEYFDRSLMRNKLALSLGASSVFADGMKWTPTGQHVEVTLNGDYVGVYLLTEDIRIDPNRLNIKKMSASAAVNDLDGGYIVEVDQRLDCYNVGDLNLQLVTAQGVAICIDTPDEGSITRSQLAYIKDLLVTVEQDVFGANRQEAINRVSFVDWYLLQELFRNNDAAFYSSDFMWKDTAAATTLSDRLLNMGPIWDFDRSAGNVNYNDNWLTEGCWVAKAGYPSWLPRLFDNPDFLNLTLARWKQKRAALATFINTGIDNYARRIELPQQRNFARWPILGVPFTNYYTFATYAEEVAFVKWFLNDRMAWLDKAYASPESFNTLCK